jgi:hypothetical protein
MVSQTAVWNPLETHIELKRLYIHSKLQNVLVLYRKNSRVSRRKRIAVRTFLSKHVQVLARIKIWSRVSTGPETKNNCAGEGQQKITALHEKKSRNFSPAEATLSETPILNLTDVTT